MSSREQREEHADRQHVPRGDHAPRRSAPDERGDEREVERGRPSDDRARANPHLTERERRERWPLG
jgi:hypothetical protein